MGDIEQHVEDIGWPR